MKTTGNPQPDWKPEAKWAVEEDHRHHQAKIMNWPLRAEEFMRNWTPEEKAENVRDMPDTALAALFDNMMFIMGWNIPDNSFMRPIKESLAIENAMKTLRTDIEVMLERHYLETGED